MSSARRIAANRRNAQRSRGPRTPAGKARASRNSFRHGLAVSVLENTATSIEVERLARTLGGDDQRLVRYARAIAEARLDLERIERMKVLLMNRHLAAAGLATSAATSADRSASDPLENEESRDQRALSLIAGR